MLIVNAIISGFLGREEGGVCQNLLVQTFTLKKKEEAGSTLSKTFQRQKLILLAFMAPFHPTAQEMPFYLFFQTSPPPIHYRSGFVKGHARLLTMAAIFGSQLFLAYSHLERHPSPLTPHPSFYLNLHPWGTYCLLLIPMAFSRSLAQVKYNRHL